MKKIVKLIEKIMLATVITATGIGLTACQSSNINSSSTEKTPSENRPSSSSSESSNNIQTGSNSDSTSKIMVTIENAAKYIRKNYTDKNLSETAPYSYKITSQTYKGYKTEVYAFADSEVYSEPNKHIWIKINTKLDNCYMSVAFELSKYLVINNKADNCYVSVLYDEPSTLFTADSYRIAGGYVAIPLTFNSETKLLIKNPYNFENSIISKSDAENYAAIQIDFGLQYVSAFLRMIGCDIKDLGFTNY